MPTHSCAGCGLLAAVVASLAFPSVALAEDAPYKPMLLVGAGAGVTDALGLALEAHLGFGVHRERVRFAGVVDVAQSTGESILGYWRITRRQVALSGLAVLSPFEGVPFHLHGSLGFGHAWDQLEFDGLAAGETKTFVAVGSLGAGYHYLSLLARLALPTSLGNAESRTYSVDHGLQVLLAFSATFDFGQ